MKIFLESIPNNDCVYKMHANCKMLTNSTSVPAAQRMCMMRYRLGGLVDHPRAVFSPSA